MGYNWCLHTLIVSHTTVCGKILAEENWQIMSYWLNFYWPIAFTCTVHQNIPNQIFPVHGNVHIKLLDTVAMRLV